MSVREGAYVCKNEIECVCERERECVCVCICERVYVCMYVRVSSWVRMKDVLLQSCCNNIWMDVKVSVPV